MPQMLGRMFFLFMAFGLFLAGAYFAAGTCLVIWGSLMAYEYGFLFRAKPLDKPNG